MGRKKRKTAVAAAEEVPPPESTGALEAAIPKKQHPAAAPPASTDEAPAPPAIEAAVIPPASAEPSDDDLALWRHVTRDTRPLADRPPPPERKVPDQPAGERPKPAKPAAKRRAPAKASIQPAPPPPRNGWRTFGIVVITMAITLGVGYWAVKTYMFPTEFTPVTLNQKEQQRLEQKLERLEGHVHGCGLTPPELQVKLSPELSEVPDNMAVIRASDAYGARPGYPARGGTFYVYSRGEHRDGHSGRTLEYRMTAIHEAWPGHHLLDVCRWSLPRAVRRRGRDRRAAHWSRRERWGAGRVRARAALPSPRRARVD